MKTKLLILATLLVVGYSQAQLTTTNVTVFQTNVVAVITQTNVIWQTNEGLLPAQAAPILQFLSQGSNWMIVPFGIYDQGDKAFGGGIAALYAVNPNLATGMRVDYLKGRLFMPSMDIQLEVPITLFGKLTTIPFTFGGIATPLTGKGKADYTPVGMFGIGLAVRVTKQLDVVADIEKWTSPFTGNQYRLGVLWKF